MILKTLTEQDIALIRKARSKSVFFNAIYSLLPIGFGYFLVVQGSFHVVEFFLDLILTIPAGLGILRIRAFHKDLQEGICWVIQGQIEVASRASSYGPSFAVAGHRIHIPALDWRAGLGCPLREGFVVKAEVLPHSSVTLRLSPPA
jgi:hypothetical protein